MFALLGPVPTVAGSPLVPLATTVGALQGGGENEQVKGQAADGQVSTQAGVHASESGARQPVVCARVQCTHAMRVSKMSSLEGRLSMVPEVPLAFWATATTV